MAVETLSPAYCTVCDAVRPRHVVERFPQGAFVECQGCGVQFANAQQTDLHAYYREIWSEGNLGCEPYREKTAAAHDPDKMEEMLATVPRFRWAVQQLRTLEMYSWTNDPVLVRARRPASR